MKEPKEVQTSNVIRKEYPEGYRTIRMQLIRELQHHQSWANMQEISKALSNVCFHAQSMIAEQKLFGKNEDTGHEQSQNQTSP